MIFSFPAMASKCELVYFLRIIFFFSLVLIQVILLKGDLQLLADLPIQQTNTCAWVL